MRESVKQNLSSLITPDMRQVFHDIAYYRIVWKFSLVGWLLVAFSFLNVLANGGSAILISGLIMALGMAIIFSVRNFFRYVVDLMCDNPQKYPKFAVAIIKLKKLMDEDPKITSFKEVLTNGKF